METRGIRNNNPANIRRTRGASWKGASPKQTDSEFVHFESMVYGVRALIVLLRTYKTKYNLTSVESIITRFAPASENDTKAYISYVCSVLHCLPDYNLTLNFHRFMYSYDLYNLCRAICKMESGYQLELSVFQKAINIL